MPSLGGGRLRSDFGFINRLNLLILFFEIDRNNTHQMLVKMLLESKSESTKKRAEKFVIKANELRKKADKLAARKKYKEAIATLEASTKELVRAIRVGGVFIPG
ncbi:MAG: hypothetical protein HQL69_22210 [Magnetococcales bacterium]|nr:hypothetical protein [Magnetococcales bacterium]